MYKLIRVLKQLKAQSLLTLVLLGGSFCLLLWTSYTVKNEQIYRAQTMTYSHKREAVDTKNPKSLQTLDVLSLQNPSSDLQEEGLETQACIFPEVDAFAPPAYNAFLKGVYADNYEYCWENNIQIFHSSIYSKNLIKLNQPETNNLTHCVYRYLTRSNKTESKILFSQEVFNITQEITKIPPNHEFIAAQCVQNDTNLLYHELHAFVPFLGVSKAETYPTNLEIQQKRPNVIILILDSVSRLSLIRTMPKTYAHLTKTLGAVELTGFVKVGDNTLPNILPLLTGKSWSETESENGCVPISSTSFDNCSFIWKDFKKLGYTTAFAEDADSISTFNYNDRRGFTNQPTDSYLRPFIRALTLANLTTDECIGSQNRLQFLIDYMKKVAVASNVQKNRPSFQFVISVATHDTNVHAINQDDFLEQFLQWCHSQSFLKNSIFFLMSDHGSRWGYVNRLPQGYIESRMPFAYFMLPHWFQTKFPLAMKNLRKNQPRLSTTFDIYETLKDILALSEALSDTTVQQRSTDLASIKSHKLPRGISLFLPIPLKRTCSMAGISGLYCICNLDESTELNLKSELVLSATKDTIRFINGRISDFGKDCHKMKLDVVISARLRMDEGDGLETIDLTLVTQPGNATFEVTLLRQVVTLGINGKSVRMTRRRGGWKIVDELARTDQYRTTGWCSDNKVLKMYCICKEPHPDNSEQTSSIKPENKN